MSPTPLFSILTAGLACLAPFASAYTTPTGAAPVDNPIYAPGLSSVVPVGTPYNITWQPTTDATVTLVLLKGPATNAVPQYAIVEKIPNLGSYSWTPATDLVPGTTGYGIQLIDDETGQYQYSTQFGIANPSYSSSSSSSIISASSTSAVSTSPSAPVAYMTSSLTLSTSWTAPANATSTTVPPSYNTTTPMISTGYPIASTGGLPINGSIVYPTGSMTIPSSLATYASASSLGSYGSATGTATVPVQTGAGVAMGTSFISLVVAAGVAVFAF